MRISDWSSDVCSSDLASSWGFDIDAHARNAKASIGIVPQEILFDPFFSPAAVLEMQAGLYGVPKHKRRTMELLRAVRLEDKADAYARSEEHTSELQSLMRISYAVFCLKKKRQHISPEISQAYTTNETMTAQDVT